MIENRQIAKAPNTLKILWGARELTETLPLVPDLSRCKGDKKTISFGHSGAQRFSQALATSGEWMI
jgi:hypothetical protein